MSFYDPIDLDLCLQFILHSYLAHNVLGKCRWNVQPGSHWQMTLKQVRTGKVVYCQLCLPRNNNNGTCQSENLNYPPEKPLQSAFSIDQIITGYTGYSLCQIERGVERSISSMFGLRSIEHLVPQLWHLLPRCGKQMC